MKDKRLGIGLFIFAILQLGLSLFGFRFWRCPWKELTGWRCPGCGLTTGCKAVLHGEFKEAILWNWLSPFVVIGLILVVIGMVLPVPLRSRLLHVIKVWEGRLRVVLIISLVLIIQLFMRLVGFA